MEKRTVSNELPIELNLALAVPNKPAKLEFILEKAVELGVRNIYLIKTEFSQFAHQLRLDRLEKIILEATEQSERAILPQLQSFHSLKQFLASKPENLCVALERSEQSLDLLTTELSSSLTLLIGPEGGFSPSERQLLTDHNIQHYKLGGSILRMETAALLSLGVVRLRVS
jgi:16S rRNA (uracil1498-N3)-methyltransferase